MFQNPMNDFYRAPQYAQFPPQQPNVHCRFVTNIEEARAAMIDPLSMNIYLDSSSGKIYFKRINNNGQAEFLSYSADEPAGPKNADCFSEINSRLARIESYLGDIRNAESIPDNEQSAGISQQPSSGAHAADDGAEPGGLQKNAGNDKWKKRQ